MRMRTLKRAGLALATVLVFSSFGFAEGRDKEQNKNKRKDKGEGRFDVSLGYAGVFSKTSRASLGNVSVKPTTSGAILATFRYRFNHTNGIELNLAHTNNSGIFSIPPDTFRIMTGITEYSGAYVLSPFHGGRIDPFVFGGGGVLRFNPGNQYIDGFQSSLGATRQSELAVLYGGGADYRLWKALAFRVQYRGLIYKVPDFKQTRFFTGAMGHMAEPSAGFVIKF
jgi:outer membrane immunogenic protein